MWSMGYPIEQGYILVWTHGSVQHDELTGRNMNYHKNGREIPALLLIRWFMGKSVAEEVVGEAGHLERK